MAIQRILFCSSVLLCATWTASVPRCQTSAQVPIRSTLLSGSAFSFADFDSDGYPDMVVGADWGTTIAFHRNFSASMPGILGAPQLHNLAGSSTSLGTRVGVGDIDTDGRPDVVIASGPGSSCSSNQQLQVFRNTTAAPGPFTFAMVSSRTLSYAAAGVAVADLLPAAGLEVAIADRCADAIQIYTNVQSPLGPTLSLTIPVDVEPMEILCADIDGDGNVDVVTNNQNSISFAFNQGGGNFTAAFPVGVGPATSEGYISLADVNGDGLLDFVRGRGVGPVEMGLQVPPHSFSVTALPLTGTFGGFESAAFGDIDGDGRPDLVGSRNQGAGMSDVIIALNTGVPGYFSGGVLFASSLSGRGIVGMEDLDGVPGDDLVRILPHPGTVPDLDVWRNTTTLASSSYPGHDTDLQLLTSITRGGTPASMPGAPLKTTTGGDFVEVRLSSPAGAHIGQTPIIASQFFLSGSPWMPALSPMGIWIDPSLPVFYFYNGLGSVFPGVLPATGLTVAGIVPVGVPPGLSLIVQGFTLAGSSFASTEAHEIRFF